MSAMLFAYGTLIPPEEARVHSEGWVADAVRGRLFDFGPHPGLVDLDGPDAGWVTGYVRPVEMAELEGPLDAYEDVGKGLFRRAQTTTRAGRIVWVYVFSGPLPPYARGPLKRWLRPGSPSRTAASPGAYGVGDNDVGNVDAKETKA
jgi:gamma-glutamylcyclotransferase (GGCT)/AIG2-like uncharacterized protein YtfP